MPVFPSKTDAVLRVDTDAMLTMAIARQTVQTVAGRKTKIEQAGGRMQMIEPLQRNPMKFCGKTFYKLLVPDVFGSLVLKRPDHRAILVPYNSIVKHNPPPPPDGNCVQRISVAEVASEASNLPEFRCGARPSFLLPGALPHEGINEGKARMFPERNEWLSTGAQRRSGTATRSYAKYRRRVLLWNFTDSKSTRTQ
jgi:hypothetical protein